MLDASLAMTVVMVNFPLAEEAHSELEEAAGAAAAAATRLATTRDFISKD